MAVPPSKKNVRGIWGKQIEKNSGRKDNRGRWRKKGWGKEGKERGGTRAKRGNVGKSKKKKKGGEKTNRRGKGEGARNIWNELGPEHSNREGRGKGGEKIRGRKRRRYEISTGEKGKAAKRGKGRQKNGEKGVAKTGKRQGIKNRSAAKKAYWNRTKKGKGTGKKKR